MSHNAATMCTRQCEYSTQECYCFLYEAVTGVKLGDLLFWIKPREVHNLSFPVPVLCLNSNLWLEHCKVVKYFENNLSGLHASLTLKHWERGWDMSEEEGYGWGGEGV